MMKYPNLTGKGQIQNLLPEKYFIPHYERNNFPLNVRITNNVRKQTPINVKELVPTMTAEGRIYVALTVEGRIHQ